MYVQHITMMSTQNYKKKYVGTVIIGRNGPYHPNYYYYLPDFSIICHDLPAFWKICHILFHTFYFRIYVNIIYVLFRIYVI